MSNTLDCSICDILEWNVKKGIITKLFVISKKTKDIINDISFSKSEVVKTHSSRSWHLSMSYSILANNIFRE